MTATHPPLVTADIFGGQAFGTIFGSLMILNGIGGAFGAWFAGFIYDVAGSYLPVFVILIIFALFSSLSIWWAAPRKIRRVPGKAKYGLLTIDSNLEKEISSIPLSVLLT